MTVIDGKGFLYVMGGSDFDGQQVLNDGQQADNSSSRTCDEAACHRRLRR